VADVDLVVQAQGQSGPGGTRERFPDAVVAQVRAVDGVRAANGVVWGYAQFVDADGEAIRKGGAPTLGADMQAPISACRVAAGNGPARLVAAALANSLGRPEDRLTSIAALNSAPQPTVWWVGSQASSAA